MGADGHIAYFDKNKVKQIKEEVKEKYPHQDFNFDGYECSYTVNNKEVCVSYWDNSAHGSKWGAEGSQLSDYYDNNEAQKEFAKRIAAEALIIEDQEVWT